MGVNNNVEDTNIVGGSQNLIASISDLLYVGIGQTTDVVKKQIQAAVNELVQTFFDILVPTEQINEKITAVFNPINFPSSKYNIAALEGIRSELLNFITPSKLIDMISRIIVKIKNYIVNINKTPFKINMVQNIVFELVKDETNVFLKSLQNKIGKQNFPFSDETAFINKLEEKLKSLFMTEGPKMLKQNALKVFTSLVLGETYAIPGVSGVTKALESAAANIAELELQTIGKTAMVLGELLAKKSVDTTTSVKEEPIKGGYKQKKIEYKTIIRRIQSSIHAFRNTKSNNTKRRRRQRI